MSMLDQATALGAVKVFFKDKKYNCITGVSTKTTLEDAKSYFLNKMLNLGGVKDDLHECIGIILYDTDGSIIGEAGITE